MTTPVAKFHLYKINTTNSGKVSFYINTCDVTKDKKCTWLSKSIGISDKLMVNDGGYWPKTVRITDSLVYLVGGSKAAINFLKYPDEDELPTHFISLVGLNSTFSFIHD
jgi:hypothetical protein